MKKIIIFLISALIIGIAPLTYAGEGCRVSGPHNSNTLIMRTGGLFCGFVITTDGTNNVTVNIYDNNSAVATGQRLIPTDFVVVGGSYFGGITFEGGEIPVSNGIYITISGTGANVTVYYKSSGG